LRVARRRSAFRSKAGLLTFLVSFGQYSRPVLPTRLRREHLVSSLTAYTSRRGKKKASRLRPLFSFFLSTAIAISLSHGQVRPLLASTSQPSTDRFLSLLSGKTKRRRRRKLRQRQPQRQQRSQSRLRKSPRRRRRRQRARIRVSMRTTWRRFLTTYVHQSRKEDEEGRRSSHD
jgi:hypothetical protein